MLQKSNLSRLINFSLLAILGIVFLLSSINCYNGYCSDPLMEQLPLAYNFREYYDFYRYAYFDNLILGKFIDYGSGFSFGNIDQKIDFKRDFHFYLWDYFNLNSYLLCYKNYGIAVVLGPYTAKSYKYQLNEGYLVKGLEKSIVIIFNSNKHKISILNCLEKPCNPNSPDLEKDYKALNELIYLDMHILYSASTHSITIYKDDYNYPSNYILKYEKAYLMNTLVKENGWGYIGITATDKNCQYRNDLIYSYICINGGEHIKPSVYLSYGKETINPGESIIVPPFQTLTLNAVYSSNTEFNLMGPGYITVNGWEYKEPAKSSGNKYSFNYYTTSDYGKYDLVYHTYYDHFTFTIYVQSTEVSKLNYIYGRNENDLDNCYELIDGTRVLKYGGSGECGYDFDISDFKQDDSFLHFYVESKDDYGQYIDIKDEEKIKNDLQNDFKYEVTLNKVKEYTYKIGVKVTKKGYYTIYSSYLDHPIAFNVMNLIPDISNSKCKIENCLANAYKSEQDVKYICEFKDNENNLIDIKESQTLRDIKVYTYLYRVKPIESLIKEKEGCEDNQCSYTYTTGINGMYKFVTKLKIGNDETILSADNTFYVSPEPKSLEECFFYNYDTDKWININDVDNSTEFYYHEEKEDNDNLLLIDLVDIKDPDKTKYSEFGYYPYDNLNLDSIKGNIAEDHSGFYNELSFQIYTFKGKEYILVKLDKSKERLRRSTLPYTITIEFGKEKDLILKYYLNIGDYEACGKELNINNSIIKNIENSIIAGSLIKVAELILITDYPHIYNYFLDDQNKISYNVENNDCIENGKCKVEITKNSIEGIYDLKFMAEKKGKYKVSFEIDGESLSSNSFEVDVEPIADAFSLEKITPYKNDYTAGENVIFTFRLKDKYGNIIDCPLPPDNFGLSYSLIINSEEQNFPTINFTKNEGEDFYYIQETHYKSGSYILTLKTKYPESENSAIIFEYIKHPGSAYYYYSSLRVINNNKLMIGDDSKVELNLYDKYRNYINSDFDIYDNELKRVKIFASNEKDDILTYVKENEKTFISKGIENEGSYHLYGYIDDIEINSCLSCYFEVINTGFDFSKSQLKMIGEKTILMTAENYYNLYKGLQRPAFEFDFMNKNGLPSSNVDPNTTINAYIKIKSEEAKKELVKRWIGPNKLIWILPETYELEEAKVYTILIDNDNSKREYYIKIVDYGDDKTDGNFDITKTFISPNILYLTAGISDTFVIEFRGSDNLRYNGEIELQKLKYKKADSLIVSPKLGNKNGQIIVEVISETVCDFSQDCTISLSYDGEPLVNAQIVVSSGELGYFEVDPKSIADEENNILNEGTAGSSTKITLIPKDKYGNIIKDNIFDTKVFSEESFSYLFNLIHEEGYKTTISSSTNPVSHLVEISLSSDKIGTLTLSSIYLKKIYTMKIVSGGPSKNSEGYLEGDIDDTIAGTTRKFVIEPKDENGNEIPEDVILDIINDYSVRVLDIDGNVIIDKIEPKYNRNNSVIEYEINITDAKTAVVKAYYKDEEIIINNNIINVVNGEPEFSNTKLIYNDNEYSINADIFKLSLKYLPIIDLQLYDKYGNKIDLLTNYDLNFSLIVGEQISDYIIYNNYVRLYIVESKIDNYFKIKGTEKAELYININDEMKNITINFIDEAPQTDNDEAYSFILSADDLILKAGEEGMISLTFYTNKGRPMGHFFDPKTEIDISFSDDKKINYEIYYGQYYGTYNIIISSDKVFEEEIKCNIRAINKVKEFNIKIIPNKASRCELSSTSTGAKAGEIFSLLFKCFDKYNNKAHLDNNEFGALIINRENGHIKYDINSNEDSFNLYFEPTLDGEYIIKSKYLDEDIKINISSGDIDPENSYLEIKDNAKAGEELDINIHVFDKYGNVVELDESQKSIFDLYYRYKENGQYNKYEKIDSTPEISKNVIKYTQKVTKDGVNEFRGIYPPTNTIIKCSNCEIKVNPGKLDLNHTDVYKFNSFSKTYTKLNKDNDVLYNYEEDLLIKVYPKDEFGNKVSLVDLDIKVTLGEDELSQFGKTEEYVEFKDSKENFSALNGETILIITEGEQKVEYNIYVSGKDGFNEETIDPSKTKLLESNLEFTVGYYGYFNIEIRNTNNARYNGKFEGSIELQTSDNIKYTIYNRYSSTIFIIVTSDVSNTFPNVGDSNLDVFINEFKALNLELFIQPGDLSKAKINPIYLEPNSSNILKQKPADEDYKFSLIGYDSLGNKVLINANEAQLTVKDKNEKEVPYKTSYQDLSTGEQIYLYELSSVGTYNIISGSNNKKENLFDGIIYSVEITYGKLCPEKTIAKLVSNPLVAGSTATVIIYARDKNNNEVVLNNEIVNEFFAYILSDKYDKYVLEKDFSSGTNFKYEIQLNRIGSYQFYINYLGRKIKCDKLKVNPSICKPENTLIYSKDKNGKYVELNDETNIYSSYNSPLSLHLTFRDEFNNIITNINDISVEDAYLSGNNMEPLKWTYRSGELYLDLTDNKNKKILEHLVTRIGEKAYNFNFTIKYGESEYTFSLKVNHFSAKENEEDYGNGDYILDNCELSTNRAEFRAGTYYEVLLTLKTKENLIYNGDFNIEYIKCDQLYPEGSDETFECSKQKKDIGVYALKYYTTKPKKEEDGIKNIIKLYDSFYSQNREFEVLLVNKYGIPYKEGTKIITGLNEKITSNENNQIEFILADEYGNQFDSEEIKSYLYFENHGIDLKKTITFNSNNNIFTASLTINYPPRDISIQLYYRDDFNNIELFSNPQTSEFYFDIDYSNTVVNSKNVNKMKAGDLLDLNIILYDKYRECYIDDNNDSSSSLYATVQGPLETSTEMRTYKFIREETTSACKYVYKIVIDDQNKYTTTGTYSIVVYAGENKEFSSAYTQTLISGDIDPNKFLIYYIDMNERSYTDLKIPAGETVNFMVQAYDQFGNKIDHESLSTELFKIQVNGEDDLVDIHNGGSGALSCSFNSTKAGIYKFTYSYEENAIKDNNFKPNEINYVAGPCSEENPQITYPEEDDMDVSKTYNYIIKCLDKYNNTVTEGGSKFTSEISLFIIESQTMVDITPKIDDKNNGSYEISFIPPLAGEYQIKTFLDGNVYDELKFNLTAQICPKFTCPNNGKCVDDLRYCIPDDYRCTTPDNETKPFKCPDSDECVESFTDCIPSGEIGQCNYMKGLYPKELNYLCPYYLPLDCKRKYPSYRELCEDGICRSNRELQPNRRVCPIGKVLCVDLTCKDKFEDCYNGWEPCKGTEVRCPDQSCADDQKNCPTTITCSNPSHYVCPDGSCVENEIYCPKLKTCPDETPYLCTDNSCATSPDNCPHTVACGHGKSLCSDLICRESC